MTRGLFWVLALFFVGGTLMLAGATWGYLDEHSGTAAEAKVIRCETHGSGKYKNTHCTGTWTVGERTVTGAVYNGRKGDVGKTISVRLHGNHASKPQLWVSIGLAVMGLFVLAVGVMFLVQVRRRSPPPSTAA